MSALLGGAGYLLATRYSLHIRSIEVVLAAGYSLLAVYPLYWGGAGYLLGYSLPRCVRSIEVVVTNYLTTCSLAVCPL